MTLVMNPAASQLQSEVESLCKVNLDACLQCGCCTGSCTGIECMDYSPRQIIQMVKLDYRQTLLTSAAIWLCASCHICEDRCPAGIKIAVLMDTLREIAVNEQAGLANNQLTFHSLFLKQVSHFSRLHEGLLAFNYSSKAKTPLPELKLMFNMLVKARVDLKPPRRPSHSFKKVIGKLEGKRGKRP